jgi:hypothetical protein
MSGLHEAFDEMVADVPIYGDLDRAVEQAERERRHRYGVLAGLAAAAAAVTVIVSVLATTLDANNSQQPIGPSTPTGEVTPPSETSAPTNETIPLGPSEALVVRQRGHRLEVAGEIVPGKWQLIDSRRDVWVAMNTDEDGYESQWWGKGTTTHKMPPSVGSVLRGGVVISQDAHWIVWTRPAADVYDKSPPRVMEVVDTATGKVHWSRNADADAPEIAALAVTNDGVVVFGHCLKPVFDSGGWPQCDDARVDLWAPEAGVTGTLPAEVLVGDEGPPGTVTSLSPLVQVSGAHNGLLVKDRPSSRPQYVRVTERGDVEAIAILPRDTVAVTADERFALLSAECTDGLGGCGWSVLPLDGGERRTIPSLADIVHPQSAYLYSFVIEGDDRLLVREPGARGGAVGRCSLAQARCVLIRP